MAQGREASTCGGHTNLSVPAVILVPMARRALPDLSPEQVVRLQDALLSNADALLTSALAVLKLGFPALARALAILGMEESGKAIGIHERRVAMPHLPDGSGFRCEDLDDLWSSHQRKLDLVYAFLRDEDYWFDTQPPDHAENEALLGSVKRWALKHDNLKQRGFYVDLNKLGEPLSPADLTDDVQVEHLAQVIEFVHQIGWQLRLGEHIEGKKQDQQTTDVLPRSDEELAWLDDLEVEADSPEQREIFKDMRESMKEGTPGTPLNNAGYRFNPPDADRSNPFRNLGKPGYEAETRELIQLAESFEQEDEA